MNDITLLPKYGNAILLIQNFLLAAQVSEGQIDIIGEKRYTKIIKKIYNLFCKDWTYLFGGFLSLEKVTNAPSLKELVALSKKTPPLLAPQNANPKGSGSPIGEIRDSE
jgi:hypothetical protein